jgi:hypothetical protein
MKRYRLTARAQIHGEVRGPGYEFDLADGELGPHRTLKASDHGAQLVGYPNYIPERLVDKPLYEEVPQDGRASP